MVSAIIAHLDGNMNRFYSLFRLASTREKGPMSNKAWEAAKSIAAVERQARLTSVLTALRKARQLLSLDSGRATSALPQQTITTL